MTVLGKHKYRIAFDFGNVGESWIDYETGGVFQFPSGVSLKIQIGIRKTKSPETFFSTSTGDKLKLEIKKLRYNKDAPDADDPAYMAQEFTVLEASTITLTDWQAGTHQHATFDYSAAQTSLPVGKYWMVISGVLADGAIISLGWAKMEVVQDGTGPETTVAPELPAEYSASQVDALLAAKQVQIDENEKNLLRANIASVIAKDVDYSLSSGSGFYKVNAFGCRLGTGATSLSSNFVRWGDSFVTQGFGSSFEQFGKIDFSRPGGVAFNLGCDTFPTNGLFYVLFGVSVNSTTANINTINSSHALGLKIAGSSLYLCFREAEVANELDLSFVMQSNVYRIALHWDGVGGIQVEYQDAAGDWIQIGSTLAGVSSNAAFSCCVVAEITNGTDAESYHIDLGNIVIQAS